MTTNWDQLFGLKPEGIKPAIRATHTYVIGQPGTGKSRGLESWIRQDIDNGYGVGVIDPHGDLFTNLIAYLATKPEVWEKVIIFDPCQPKWITPFNPLLTMKGISPQRLSLFMTDIVVKIWGIDPTSSPRMVWLLTNSFLALADLGLTLLDLPQFLLDSDYRESWLPKIRQEQVKRFFKDEFPQSQTAVHQWVTPVLNKIGGLLFDPDIRLLLAGKPRFNFRDVLDQQLIFLANIPKGIIGEGTSALLGALLVAQFQKAALSRADVSSRQNFYLYLDEFQNYTTDNIKDILSESRKYGLSLTLANQYLEQIQGSLRSAVLNTSGTIISFRVGYQDATQISKEIWPAGDTSAKDDLAIKRLGKLAYINWETKDKSLGWDDLASKLATLPSREFWSKQRGKKEPTHQRTFTTTTPVMTKELKDKISQLLDASGRRYGRLKVEAQQDVKKGNVQTGGGIKEEGIPPFWGQ